MEKIIKKIRQLRRNYQERVSAYRKTLQESLEKECLDNGGHFWWPWQEKIVYSIGGEILHTHTRHCQACWRTEYKKEQ